MLSQSNMFPIFSIQENLWGVAVAVVVDVAAVVEAARFDPPISIFVAFSFVNICNEECVNSVNALLNIVS